MLQTTRDDMSIALYQLHQGEHCHNGPADIERMTDVASSYSFNQARLEDSLISAISSNHDNCCDFLNSIGATIARDISFLISLKFLGRDVLGLKLALKYIPRNSEYLNSVMSSVSRVFKPATITPKLIQVFEEYGIDTVSFLLPMLQSSTPRCDNLIVPICYIVYMKQLKRLLLQGLPVEHRHLPNHQDTTCNVSLASAFFGHLQHCEHHSQSDRLVGVGEILHHLGANLRQHDTLLASQVEAQSCMYDLTRNPQSLKSQCRLALLRRLRDNYLPTVEQWSDGEVPHAVTEFLRGSDLQDL